MRLKKYEDARKVSETALQISPGLKEASINFCLCELLLGGALKQIVSILQKLLNGTTEHPTAIALLGSTLAIQGKTEQAAENMKLLENMGFSRSYYLHDLSQKLVAYDRVQDAVSLLRFSVQSGNGSPEINDLLDSLTTS